MNRILLTGLTLWLSVMISSPAFTKVDVIPTKEEASIKIVKGVPMNQPSDVHIGNNGKIYLLDGVNNRVLVFSSRYEYITQFGSKGHGAGQMWFPMGITVDRRGNVYVADSGNQRINIYNEHGTFQSSFDLAWKEPLKPSDPTDLIVDEDTGNCYIVDNDNNRILVYSISGKYNFQWGFRGKRKGEFRYPFSITLDAERNIYIVDVINARVQVFNLKGEFLSQIGRWGITPGEFYRPKGITADSENRIYVAGSYVGYGNIQVFSKDGEFLGIIGSQNNKGVRFYTPVGIFFDNNTRKLYVVEMKENRLRIFKVLL